MILYFSATGNCRYVAERMAKALGDQAVDIMNLTEYPMDGPSSILLHVKEDRFGIVTPTYVYGLPKAVEDILSCVKIGTDKPVYSFIVATFGTSPGNSGRFADKALERNANDKFNAYYSVKMPDTYTPLFDLSDKEKVSKQNEEAEIQIDRVIELIKQRAQGNYMQRKLPAFLMVTYRPVYNFIRRTSVLHVEESCIGCGLCARNCPEKAIKMCNEKPVWTKKRCQMCLRCLHTCPRFAIQVMGLTKKHGQYTNPHSNLH